MKKNDKSQLFKEYNKARAAARVEGSDVKRLNRGLGVAQKSQPRPYVTTAHDCSCPDHFYRGVVCKHMIALRLQEEKAQSIEENILKELGF